MPSEPFCFAPTLWDLFDDAAHRAGDKAAIVVDGEDISYRRLRDRAARGAEALRAAVGAQARVAVALPNSIDWVVAYLAAHAAGVSLVAVNYRYTDDEVERLLVRTGAAAVICEQGRALGTGMPPDRLDQTWLRQADVTTTSGEARQAATNERMVVFTSGTSGTPKAIRCTDENEVLGGILLNMRYTSMSPDDRYLIITPLSHRPALARLQAALATGATAVIPGDYRPTDLLEILERERITTIGTVPTALRDLVVALAGKSLPSVRTVHVASDALRPELFSAARRAFPEARFVASYAGSETGYVAISTTADLRGRPDAVGRVVPGVEVRVVRADGQLAGPMESGELLVRAGEPGSYTVAAGYVDDDLSGAFVDADGWFPTGDLGYIDDGFLIFTGRSKNIVVSGGMNISITEVEDVLMAHPDVSEVALLGLPDERLGERLVGLVVGDGRRGGRTILDELRTGVAGYKLPRELRWVDRIPRTETGKVARSQLLHHWENTTERETENHD